MGPRTFTQDAVWSYAPKGSYIAKKKWTSGFISILVYYNSDINNTENFSVHGYKSTHNWEKSMGCSLIAYMESLVKEISENRWWILGALEA